MPHPRAPKDSSEGTEKPVVRAGRSYPRTGTGSSARRLSRADL